MLEKSKKPKGQLISKTNCQAEDSSKKQTNEFVFTTYYAMYLCFFWKKLKTPKNLLKLPDL